MGLVRQGFENRFVAQLTKAGASAVVTYDLLSLAEIKQDKRAAAERFRASGAEAVLILRLVDTSSSYRESRAGNERYVPVLTGVDSVGWYDYYSVGFMDMSSTYGSLKQTVYLETSLYDLKTEKRLWSGLTRDSREREYGPRGRNGSAGREVRRCHAKGWCDSMIMRTMTEKMRGGWLGLALILGATVPAALAQDPTSPAYPVYKVTNAPAPIAASPAPAATPAPPPSAPARRSAGGFGETGRPDRALSRPAHRDHSAGVGLSLGDRPGGAVRREHEQPRQPGRAAVGRKCESRGARAGGDSEDERRPILDDGPRARRSWPRTRN